MDLETMKTIREDEGISLTVYEDTTGHLTVGIGHKVLPEDNLRPGDEISHERATTMFLSDLKEADYGAHLLLSGGTWSVPPLLLRVVTNMVFQMGLGGVRSFRRWWGFLEARNYERAAKEMLDSKWARDQSPARAKRLAHEVRLLGRTKAGTVGVFGGAL